MTKQNPSLQATVEHIATRVADSLGPICGVNDVAYILVLGQYGDDQEGWLHWVTNTKSRDSTPEILRQLADSIEAGANMPPREEMN